MKKVFTLLAATITVASLLTSCVSTVQVPKFASIEQVIDLKLGSSLPEVVSTLGSKPYNIYSNQKDGYVIYIYKYKLVERAVRPSLINYRGGETTGTEVYNSNEQNLFLLFKEGKLESFVTTEGRKDAAAYIMIDNTLHTISKDKEKYIILPTSVDGEKSGFLKKKKDTQ